MPHCALCKRHFKDGDLLQNSRDDFFCKECFKYQYLVNKRSKGMFSNRYEGDSYVTHANKMFSSSDLSTIRLDKVLSEKLYTSKKPLQCPHVDCNRYVSVNELPTHFFRDHEDVARLEVKSEAECHVFTFQPESLRYGVKHCIAVLCVPKNRSISNNVTLIVLASRVAAAQLECNDEPILDEECNSRLLESTDKVIVWVASNVVCNYSYSVSVSSPTEIHRLNYFGPILQLGATPEDLCLNGQCLIMSQFHSLGMTQTGLNPLQLLVGLHGLDE